MIITIGGGFGCGAKDISKMLANDLGYRYCDDEIVSEAVKNSGVDISKSAFEYFDESVGSASVEEIKKLRNVSKKYGYLTDVLTNDVAPLDKQMDEMQRKVLNSLADEDNVILLGRCANYYLKDRKNLVRVFCNNSMENCINRIYEDYETDKNLAKKVIEHTDKRRAQYYEFFTGEKWGEPVSYDIRINVAIFGYEGTAKIIEAAVDVKKGLIAG